MTIDSLHTHTHTHTLDTSSQQSTETDYHGQPRPRATRSTSTAQFYTYYQDSSRSTGTAQLHLRSTETVHGRPSLLSYTYYDRPRQSTVDRHCTATADGQDSPRSTKTTIRGMNSCTVLHPLGSRPRQTSTDAQTYDRPRPGR